MTNVDGELLLKHHALILEASGDGIYGLDCNGHTVFANPAAERMTGYTAQEMVGISSHALIHHTHADGSDFPRTDCRIYAAFKDGKVHRVSDEIFWRKDGTSFPVEYISTPIFDEGELVGAVVSFRDITERQKTEAALLESEERYRKIVAATHDIMFLMSAEDGSLLDFDDEACEMLNYSREELLQKTAFDLHAHELSAHAELMDKLQSLGRVRTEKLSCLASNGEAIPVRISASIIQLKGQDCILAMVQDLSETVEAEKQARKLQTDLHHVSRLSAMGEMASGMAHELNQPLTAVMNYLQACQMIYQSDNEEQRAKVPDYMSKAADQAERAGKIIAGLRTFVEKGDASRTLEDLNEIVEEASALLFTKAANDDTKLSFDLVADLPKICVDKIQIQQVIFNLVRNAMEALAETKKAEILICTSILEEGKIKVWVKDNGPGVEPDIQEKLFDAFTTSKADGMGVGLSICKSIVEDHGGTIRADRNEDAGMTFSFSIAAEQEERFDA